LKKKCLPRTTLPEFPKKLKNNFLLPNNLRTSPAF
jgi:hypothetical protein